VNIYPARLGSGCNTRGRRGPRTFSVTISHRSSANAHASVRTVSGRPRICSGAMYAGLRPAQVRPGPLSTHEQVSCSNTAAADIHKGEAAYCKLTRAILLSGRFACWSINREQVRKTVRKPGTATRSPVWDLKMGGKLDKTCRGWLWWPERRTPAVGSAAREKRTLRAEERR
jgi:hypothetical protein